MERRIDTMLALGLWKVCFISKNGRLCTWFVFVEKSDDKTIGELNNFPRLNKGKTYKQVFKAMGLVYVPKTKRIAKKNLKRR